MTTKIFKGRRFTNRKLADDRAWTVVKEHAPELSEAQCQNIIDTWIESGVLYEEEYYDTKLRKKRMGLFVNNAKRPGNTWEIE
jgi:hypothetical protein